MIQKEGKHLSNEKSPKGKPAPIPEKKVPTVPFIKGGKNPPPSTPKPNYKPK